MLLRQIEYFVLVVENNSFTKAAEQAFVSQSAISQQIRALEKELDVTLLVRQHRSFALTTAGEYLYRHAPKLLAQAKELEENTISVGHTNATQFTIGCVRSYIGPEFNQAVATFNSRYPQVEIKIELANHQELFDALRRDELELIFNDQRQPLSDAYVSQRIATATKMVETSVNCTIAGNTLSSHDLANFPCYVLARPESQVAETRYYREVLGITSPLRFVNSLRQARLQVAANQGWLLIDQLPTATDRAQPPLMRRPFTGTGTSTLHQPYFLFWKKKMTTLVNDAFAGIFLKEFK